MGEFDPTTAEDVDRQSPADEADQTPQAGDADHDSRSDAADEAADSVESLRRAVEAKYDFENFGPADMAEMTAEEWSAVFDADSWITGEELLDRVNDELRQRVADRDIFARVERHEDPPLVLAYSDEGYAIVHEDGTLEGEGTIRRDAEPSVALCSMASYDVPEPPSGDLLPHPEDVEGSGGDVGHKMLQVVGGVQVVAGVAVLLGGIIMGSSGSAAGGISVAVMLVAALGLIAIGIVLFIVVANARLSSRYRAEQYRDRLRALGLDDGDRPEFVPTIEDGEVHTPLPGESTSSVTDGANRT